MSQPDVARRLRARRLAAAWPSWLGPVVAVVTGCLVTAPAWSTRPIAGDDVMALLIRADRGIELARDLRVDGWSPDFLLGYQQFLFYGPGFSWAVGFVRLLGFGLPSTEAALTVVAVGAVIALGPAAWFLARSIGLDERTAGIAAVLALAVDSVFGLGTSGTFTIALVPHQLAGTFFCLALGAAARTLRDPRRRWVVLLGASLAAIVATHLFSTVTLAVLAVPVLAVLVARRAPSVDALWRLGAGGLLGLGLSAFWSLPYAAHWGDRGVVPGWAVPPVGTRADEILDGRILFGPYRGWLVLAGLMWAAGAAGVVAARRSPGAPSRRGSLVAVAAPLWFLVVAHTLASRAPKAELSPHLANRGLGYAGLLATFALAVLLADATARWPRAGHAVALAAAAAVVLVLPGSPRDDVGTQPVPVVELREAAAVLAEDVPDGARFATQRDFPDEIARLGVSHPDFWLARMSGRPTLNVFGLELSPSPGVASIPESVTTLVDEGPAGIGSLASLLRGTGTTHLVTVRESTATAIIGTDGWFEPTFRRGPVAVFLVLDPSEGPRQPPSVLVATSPAGTVVARTQVADDHHRFAFDLPVPGSVELAIGWNSRWRGVDGEGRAVRLRRGTEGGVALTLPAGATELDLVFGPDAWETAGVTVSAATATATLLVLGLTAAGRRRRRDSAAPAETDVAPARETTAGD